MITGVIILIISAVGLVWPTVVYPLLLRGFPKKGWPQWPTDETTPVTIIIPCYNESATIAAKIKQTIEQIGSRPAQIIVADDGSTDGTADAAQAASSHDNVLVLRLPRQGKNAALNAAWRQARYDVIIITDANAILSFGAINELVKPLTDERVGGVRGRYQPVADTDSAIGHGTVSYQNGLHRIFMAESDSGVLNTSGGALQAFRRKLVDTNEQRTMTEDWDMVLGVRATGHDIIYQPQAVAQKKATILPAELLRQNIRLVYGSLQTVWKYRQLFNPFRFGRLSVAWVSNKALPLLGPWLGLAFVISAGWLAWHSAALYFALLWWFISATLIIGLGLVLVHIRRSGPAVPLLGQLEYGFLIEISAAIAWALWLWRGGRNWTGWTPLRSTRERDTVANP